MSSVIHLRSLPTEVLVRDSGGTLKAGTDYEYDNYASSSPHAALIDRSSISGLDSAFTTSYTTRGNLTATTHYLITSTSLPTCSTSPSQCFSGYTQYDIAGNVVAAIDARGYATTFDFTDSFGAPNGNAVSSTAPTELSTPGKASYAFATTVTNALSQSAHVQFDYYMGKPVDAEDANGIVSSGYYDDILDRPTKVIRGVGVSGVQNQTTFAYADATREVTTTSDLTSSSTVVAKAIYDQMGRTTERRQYEGNDHHIVTETNYDVLGRAYRTSNPYRPTSPDNETAVWNTLVYDALGRTVSATTADSAVVTTSYSGNTVTATDQAGKVRRSVTDALGRMIRVDEPNSSGNLDSGGSPVQPTSYTYDVLNNLTQVTQGSQTRTFAYDSMQRPTSATNPESGTLTVDEYDKNGNVLVSTDARGVLTHVTYDELNRPTRRWFNGSSCTPQTTNNCNLPSGVVATDEVAYYYDSQSLPSGAPSYTRGYSTGALVAVTYGGGSAGTYRGYDEMGRVVRQYQRTDSVNYLSEATYNLNSSLLTETYPSVPGASDRRTVTYAPDNAGRLGSLSSSATSYAPAASVSSIGYASQNALKTETYGNSLIHAVDFNNRLQPTEIKLGTSSNSTSILDLNYSYSDGTRANNGDVLSFSYNGGGLSYTQEFTYDTLNRLGTAIEKTGSTTNWSQTNAYDRYGNRQIDYGGGSYNLAFSSSTNRITTSGYSYDSSGNLTNDGSHSYGFDAERKIATVDNTTAYAYDGEARRVKKLVGENTRFVYGIGGALIAEFDGSSGNLKKEYISGGITIEPTAVNSNGTQYPTGDHLGSPRAITNSSGSVVSRHDYMPFGEELGSGTGGRTTGMGFSNGGDNNRKKFTGYERDTETGLDFAQARFYASANGRFTSPDPFSGSAIITDPQTFNRYQYCRNNPVNSTDPTGMAAMGVMSQPSGERVNAAQGLIAQGHQLIQESEAAWEQLVKDRFEDIQENHCLNSSLASAAPATDHEAIHAAEASQPDGPTPQDTASAVTYTKLQVVSPLNTKSPNNQTYEIQGYGLSQVVTLNLSEELGVDGKRVSDFSLKVSFTLPEDYGSIDYKKSTVSVPKDNRWETVKDIEPKINGNGGSATVQLKQRNDEATKQYVTMHIEGTRRGGQPFFGDLRIRIITTPLELPKSQRDKP
jgi:RHS repeat-associated protein